METFTEALISPEDTPTSPIWRYPTLYKTDQTGKRRYWSIGYNANINKMFTRWAVVGGKEQSSLKEIKLGREKTLLGQALLRIRRAYNDKIEKQGYSPEGVSSDSTKKLQLAKPYIPPDTERTSTGNYKESNVKEFPVFVQPKLDGVRARALLVDGEVKMYSRQNKEHFWLTKIKEDVAAVLSYLPEGSQLDGELYVHGMDFSDIQSAVRTELEEHEDNHIICYWVYDVMEPDNLSTLERASILESAITSAMEESGIDKIVFVPGNEVFSHEGIEEIHSVYADNGYEGIMIRHIEYANPNSEKHVSMCKYRGGKNANLIKYKHFMDEEGTVIDIVDGKGKDKGKAILILRDPRGNEFSARPKLGFAEREEMYRDKDKYINKKYRYKYQGLSQDGVPRFPVGLCFVDGR